MRSFIVVISILAILAVRAQTVTGPARWESTIRNFEQQDIKHPPAKGSNLFVGSSSIAIWHDINESFPGFGVLNRGFGGSDFLDLLYYVDRIVIPYAPSKLFVYEGDNDLATGTEPDVVLQRAIEFRNVIAKKLPSTEVVFIAAKPSPSRWALKAKYEKFNEELKKYSAKTTLTEFADVWSPMLDKRGVVLKHIFGEDSLHMNKEGYVIWESALRPYLKAMK
ncbi:MAG TPA: GDSL-type esterase/lipase family protein [Cyclobacteriaceae bacterium]|nr:GDSL-type esterase/lipase family protein [Cyclobacteriaceae bacterium]